MILIYFDMMKIYAFYNRFGIPSSLKHV